MHLSLTSLQSAISPLANSGGLTRQPSLHNQQNKIFFKTYYLVLFMNKIPVYTIKIPEYDVNEKRPNHKKIGEKLDKIIKQHFLNKKIAIRALGSQEHEGKSQENLIKIIKQTGTDRYDSKREGDRYENVERKKIDFFAWKLKITKEFNLMKLFILEFYRWPKKSRGYPVKVDIIIIYDPNKLKTITHRYKWRRDIKRDGFVFKNQKNKKGAILGIIKII